ncbi:SpoIIE family protein phosphatase [Micromonospora sp. BQ11]|uniref:PP2C family protein-serine/threonine phosphatase n=1 Tax=Micromonospora sp. BQ11 TaxID=3452212 RepID=UPI003F88A0CB
MAERASASGGSGVADHPFPVTPADDAVWRRVLADGGETGARIDARDWSTTPLGPLADWPQSLRTALTFCLHSPTPMLLWWGEQRVVLHNDAYVPLLGAAGADALGRPGGQVWPERWDTLGPLLDGVLAGRPVTSVGPVTCSHVPVIDESGRPAGVLTQVVTVPVADDPDPGASVAAAARDVGDRQRVLRQAEALSRLAGGLSTAQDRPAIVEAVLRAVPAVFDGATARVATAAPGEPALQVAAGPGSEPADLDLDADAPLARAVRENTVIQDGTAVCVPLRYGDDGAFGALEVRWSGPVVDGGRPRELLDTVAGLCGQALQRAELADSAQAMAAFAARLSVTRSTAEAIEVILTAAPIAVGAVLPGLAMREEGRRVRLWHTSVPSSLSATFADLTIDDPRPIATALRTGERIVLTDRAEFARRFPGLPDPVGRHGLVTTVALPLLDARRRPIAALGFGWRRQRPLREGDLALLDTVADLCEQTLERVRLAAAEHNLVTRLAGRLRTSNRSTPAGLRVATRYTPAMSGLHLGGDWHDLVDLDGDGLAVVVGDVVGHRVEAAADMAQIRTVINTLIRLGVPLDEVFPRVTDLLGVGFLGTCLAMAVDPVAGRVSVARVGHPHPVLVRPGRPPERVHTANALPLGLVREPVPVTTLPFGAGDLLVAYTDGLVERRNQAYDEGVAALHAVIDAHRDAPVEAIADAVMAELAGSEDDQALVVIRHVG